jgi:hypothetical protein
VIARSRIAAALLVVGAILLIAPAVMPVQQILLHEAEGPLLIERAELEERGVEVVAYENLSDRGKELYEQTLRNDGSYRIPAGQGATDFQYRTELDADEESEPRQRFGPRVVAIERPEDGDLPTLDRGVPERRPPNSEPREASEASGETDGEPGDTTATSTDETGNQSPEQREETEYTLLRTSYGQPPLTDSGNLLRFVSVLAGVVMLGSGGYLRSKP